MLSFFSPICRTFYFFVILGLGSLTAEISPQKAKENNLLKKIQHTLLSMKTFQAAFIQETEEGMEEGNLYLKRPGKMRLEYKDPNPLLLIAHHDWLTQYNKMTGQSEQLLVEDTPAAFLLKEEHFLESFSLKKWRETAGLLTIEVTSPSLENLNMELTIIFETNPFALKQWVIKDETGYQTKVTLFNWVINAPLSDCLFKDFHS
jgi:outer membrane lipoprotein-sorting protein